MRAIPNFDEKTCVDCGRAFTPNSGVQKVCLGCRDEHRRAKGRAAAQRERQRRAGDFTPGRIGNPAPRACVVCGETFLPNSGAQKACISCRPALRAKEQVRRVEANRVERGTWKIGSTQTCPDCGDDYPYRGGSSFRCVPCQKAAATYSARKARAKVSRPQRATYRKTARLKAMFGGNRDASLERDGFRCVKCGAADGLHTHHVDGRGKGYPVRERNNALGNLITLCNGCHQRLHGLTEKVMFARYPETVLEVLHAFLHDHQLPLERYESSPSEAA